MRAILGLKGVAIAASLFTAPILSATLSASSIRARDEAIQRFEKRYLDAMSYTHPNHTVKLLGYKKIIMTPDEILDLESHIASLPQEWEDITSAYYDPVERTMRIYFPVENALVYHKGELTEANHLGEYPHSMIDGDCAVVGRYQTSHVTGVPANRIENGVIYLSEPSPVLRKHGNVHVYDFGWRHGMHHHDEDHEHHGLSARGDEDGGTCYQNHGNRVCSIAYGINEGRCSRPSGTIRDCIDYNGWPFKNCGNHSDKKAFPLSDCFVAVAKGHCWNEVERAL
jgi:hypothetical protein